MRSRVLILAVLFSILFGPDLFLAKVVLAEGLVVGVPEYSMGLKSPKNAPSISEYSGNAEYSVAAMIIREAVAPALIRQVRQGKEIAIGLGLSDEVIISEDQLSWRLRVRVGSFFSNGDTVSSKDVEYSLNRCLQENPSGAKLFDKIEAIESASLIGNNQEWISLTVSNGVSRQDVATFLANCPVLNKDIMPQFGSQAWLGNNIVGAGKYYITSFRQGKEYTLAKRLQEGELRRGPQELTIRAFREAKSGLTALRTGTVDVFFTEDREVLQKAGTDQTLVISKCLKSPIVARRGLNISCDLSLDLSQWAYSS